MVGPDSSYSPLEIHICWKVLKDDKMEPPIQTEYLRSGGATTLIFIVDWGQCSQLFRHPFADAREHRRAARQDHIRVEILTDIHVSLHDRLERRVVNAARL